MTLGMPILSVDLNCDLGEGAPHDASLMPLITSANVACGAHAGDAAILRATIALARTHAVADSAHPGFEDRAHFGRRELDLSVGVIRALVAGQVSTVHAACNAAGVTLKHVKPHGGLYTLASRDPRVAEAVAGGIVDAIGAGILLYAAPSSRLVEAARRAGLTPVAEVFADRTYQSDGQLTPRTHPDALIRDVDTAVSQVLGMLRCGSVRSADGIHVPIHAETVCVHGDGDHAVDFVRALRGALVSAGVRIRAPEGAGVGRA